MKSPVAAGSLVCAVLVASSGSADAQLQSLSISPFYPSVDVASGQHSEFAKGSAQNGFAVATYWDQWHADFDIGYVTHPLRFGGAQPSIEFGNLSQPDGTVRGGSIFAVSASGIAIGNSSLFGADMNGMVPTRWDLSTGAVSQLELPSGITKGVVVDINASGQSVGTGRPGRIARWNFDGSLAGELPIPSGRVGSYPLAINTSGQILGYAWNAAGAEQLYRWDSPSSVPQALPGMPTILFNGGRVGTMMNDRGSVLSWDKRWLAGDVGLNTLVGLPSLANPLERDTVYAPAINNNDTIVGASLERMQWGVRYRAVKWIPDDVAAVPLSTIDLEMPNPDYPPYVFDVDGSEANAINDSDVIVGTASGTYRFDSGGEVYQLYDEEVAVAWLPDGRAINLNTLIEPQEGWRLIRAMDISDTNWITGYAAFDPDGPMVGDGPLYYRMFLMQLPEPTLALPLLTLLTLSRRRHHSTL